MRSNRNRFLGLLLILSMLAGLFAGCQWPSGTTGPTGNLTTGPSASTSTAPPTTAPQPTVLPTTAPQPTVPPTTAPQPTVPPTTAPQPTVPPTTAPQPTVPPTTAPQPTVPPTTAPQPTVPPTTAPQPTVPPTTAPQPTQPPTTSPKPLPTNPINTAPSTTKPLPTTTQQQPVDPVPQFPEIKAKQAFIYDSRTDEFLYLSEKSDVALYPASITKLFTTYVALQHLSLDEQIVVGNELSFVTTDASVAGLKKGETLTAEALAYCALLPSGCDASYVLAAAAGRKLLQNGDASARDAVDAFLAECNRLAQEMGMENTNFANPDGYHNNKHKISLQAFAIIGELCMDDPVISRIAGTYVTNISYLTPQGKQSSFVVHNSNKTIDPNSEFYHRDSLGGKTGYTRSAGGCLLNAYRLEDGYILIGVFGCPDWDSRYTDANALFDFYLEIQ